MLCTYNNSYSCPLQIEEFTKREIFVVRQNNSCFHSNLWSLFKLFSWCIDGINYHADRKNLNINKLLILLYTYMLYLIIFQNALKFWVFVIMWHLSFICLVWLVNILTKERWNKWRINTNKTKIIFSILLIYIFLSLFFIYFIFHFVLIWA